MALVTVAVLLLVALDVPLPALARETVTPEYKKKIDIPSDVDKVVPPPGVEKPVLMKTNKEKKGGRYDNPMDPPDWLLAEKMQPPGLPLTPPPPAPEMPPGLMTPVAPGGFAYGGNFLGGGQLVWDPAASWGAASLGNAGFASKTHEAVPPGGGFAMSQLRLRRRRLLFETDSGDR